MITFIWGGCVPLAGVQVYVCLQLSCKQGKGLGNVLKKRKKGNGHTSLLFHCLFSSSPNAVSFCNNL